MLKREGRDDEYARNGRGLESNDAHLDPRCPHPEPEGSNGGGGAGQRDFIRKEFQSKSFLVMKLTIQHDLY